MKTEENRNAALRCSLRPGQHVCSTHYRLPRNPVIRSGFYLHRWLSCALVVDDQKKSCLLLLLCGLLRACNTIVVCLHCYALATAAECARVCLVIRLTLIQRIIRRVFFSLPINKGARGGLLGSTRLLGDVSRRLITSPNYAPMHMFDGLQMFLYSVDRYWAVTSIDYIQQRTVGRITFMIATVWIVSLIVSCFPLFGWKDDDWHKRIEYQQCLISQDVGYQVRRPFGRRKQFTSFKEKFLSERSGGVRLSLLPARFQLSLTFAASASFWGAAAADRSNSARIAGTSKTVFLFLNKRYNWIAVAISILLDIYRTCSTFPLVKMSPGVAGGSIAHGREVGGGGQAIFILLLLLYRHPARGNWHFVTIVWSWQVFATLSTFYLPLAIILFLYWRIFLTARKRIRRRKQQQQPNNGIASASLGIRLSMRGAVSSAAPTNSTSTGVSIVSTETTCTIMAAAVGVLSLGRPPPSVSDEECVEGSEQQQPTATPKPKTRPITRRITSVAAAAVAAASNTNRRRNIESRRERKAAKTLAIITGAFVVCWLPFFVIALLMPVCHSPHCYYDDNMVAFFLWLGYFNSTLNPILYTIFSPEFRNAFQKLLRIKNNNSSRPATVLSHSGGCRGRESRPPATTTAVGGNNNKFNDLERQSIAAVSNYSG